MFSRPEEFEAVSSQSMFDVLRMDCTDGESSGEEVFSHQEYSGDEDVSTRRGEFEKQYESDIIDHDNRPFVEFKMPSANTDTTNTGFCPSISVSKPTNSDPEAWRAYHANKFKGWPLEAKEELLRLRFEEFGQEFDAFGRRSNKRVQVWSELVARFDQKFPEYKLTVRKAKKHVNDYKGKYRKGLSGRRRRCPHWDLYAKYFGSHRSAVKKSSVVQEKKKSTDENDGISTTKQDQKSIEDRDPNPTESPSYSFKVDSYIVKLRMKTFEARFDNALKGERKVLWNEITASVNRKFRENISSSSVQARFCNMRGRFKSGVFSEDCRRILSEYFKGEVSVRSDAVSKAEGSKRIAGECFQTDDQASARIEICFKRPRYSRVLSTSRQDELRALSISIQKAADLLNDLVSF